MAGKRSFELGVVLLAAGSSTRMGRPKLLLPWGETTVLGHLLAQWTRLAARQIVVVCQTNDAPIQKELDRLKFPASGRVFNPDPARGMFSSIQCAACWKGWNQTLTHWAIALGDQPHLRAATLEAVLEFAKQHPEEICQPARNGRGRHPVVLPAAAFSLLAETKHATLKEFLASAPSGVSLIELDDPGLDLDIDRPADYEKALQLQSDAGGH